MVITMEECGELAQVCSKVLRSRSQLGFISDKNLVKLQQEVADVRCMMDLMYKFGLLDLQLLQLPHGISAPMLTLSPALKFFEKLSITVPETS